MDPELGASARVGSPGADPERRKSSGGRRATVPHVPQEVVDHAQLSDADRRLAEMGYVQVSLLSASPAQPSPLSPHQLKRLNAPHLSLTQTHIYWVQQGLHCKSSTTRSTNANSPGSPASPSPSPSPVCLPPSRQLSSTLSKPAALPRRSGPGSSAASAATASPSPSPSSSPPTRPQAAYTSPANTSPPRSGCPRFPG